MNLVKVLKALFGGLMLFWAVDSFAYSRVGLIAEYDFTDNAALDTSGNNNHGIVHNVQAVEDRHANPGSAMLFNGRDAWIEIPSSALYTTLSDITLSLWICPQKGPNGENRAGSLIGKQPSGYRCTSHTYYNSNHGGLFDFDLCYQDNALKLYFCSQFNTDGSEGHVANHAALQYGQWQHIVVTANRDENRVKFYVNGQLVDDVVYSTYIHIGHILSQVTNEPIRIGKRKDADFNPALYFIGAMDDIKIYNRSLSASEVETLSVAGGYRVTLNPNDGSDLVTTVLANIDEPMPEAPAPVRTGWSFIGYFDAQEGGAQYYTSGMVSAQNWNHTSNMTLYAHWEKTPLLCLPENERPLSTRGAYDGFLYQESDFDGVETVDVKGIVSLTVSDRQGQLTVSAKVLMQNGPLMFNNSVWAADDPEGVRRTVMTRQGGEVLDLYVGQDRIWGTLSGGSLSNAMFALEGARSRFSDKQDVGAQTMLNAFRGYYTLALPVYGALSLGEAQAAPAGTGYLTLTISDRGSVRIAGELADGTRVSQASSLILFDGCGPQACVPLWIPLYGRKGWVGGLLWLDPVSRTLVTDRDLGWFVRWEKPGSGVDGFSELLDACGGFYSELEALSTHYRFSAGANDVSYAHPRGLESIEPIFPAHIGVFVSGTSLVMTRGSTPRRVGDVYDYAASENSSMATLTFQPATGIFKGGFNLYYDTTLPSNLQHRIVNVRYAGVLAPVRSGVFDSLPAGQGYYLVPDNHPAVAPYRLKRSYLIELEAAE